MLIMRNIIRIELAQTYSKIENMSPKYTRNCQPCQFHEINLGQSRRNKDSNGNGGNEQRGRKLTP